MNQKTYIAIDLKSFYASVECVDLGLDPMTTNLVVADESRTQKTICLAVSPSLKAYGIGGRARLFEVVQKVKEINIRRRQAAPGQELTGASSDDTELKKSPSLAVDYIIAPPRMSYYMDMSTNIYRIYLKYIAPEDIHVYSIDEVFIDATEYLGIYGLTARELAMKLILEVLNETGITATAGIGPNLYLCKVAMDVQAKHIPQDKNGVRIAELDEMSYRRLFWDHRPMTDFWRIGPGTARKLEKNGMYTLGNVARCSVGKEGDYYNEELLYQLFGVNAELLIDHAWGWEPCTIADIKSYRPEANSMGSGQVLKRPYPFAEARIVVREMAELLALDLVEKRLVTNQMVLTVGYDIENLKDPKIRKDYQGEVTVDRYGRRKPKHAHGTANLEKYTSSTRHIVDALLELYDRILDPKLLIRRIYVTACRVISETEIPKEPDYEQLSLFVDYEAERRRQEAERAADEKERRQQEMVLDIRRRFGKNAILKGTNLQEGATARERNRQIGGHKA